MRLALIITQEQTFLRDEKLLCESFEVSYMLVVDRMNENDKFIVANMWGGTRFNIMHYLMQAF